MSGGLMCEVDCELHGCALTSSHVCRHHRAGLQRATHGRSKSKLPEPNILPCAHGPWCFFGLFLFCNGPVVMSWEQPELVSESQTLCLTYQGLFEPPHTSLAQRGREEAHQPLSTPGQDQQALIKTENGTLCRLSL